MALSSLVSSAFLFGYDFDKPKNTISSVTVLILSHYSLFCLPSHIIGISCVDIQYIVTIHTVKQEWAAPRAVSICLDTEVTMGCQMNRQFHLCWLVWAGASCTHRLYRCQHSSLSHLISGRYDENGHCLMSNLNTSNNIRFTFTIKIIVCLSFSHNFIFVASPQTLY